MLDFLCSTWNCGHYQNFCMECSQRVHLHSPHRMAAVLVLRLNWARLLLSHNLWQKCLSQNRKSEWWFTFIFVFVLMDIEKWFWLNGGVEEEKDHGMCLQLPFAEVIWNKLQMAHSWGKLVILCLLLTLGFSEFEGW